MTQERRGRAALDSLDPAARPRLVVGGLPVKAGLHSVELQGFELRDDATALLACRPAPAGGAAVR